MSEAKKKKNPGGQPTKYKEIFVDQAYSQCRKYGCADKDLCELFGVSISTITNWKNDHPKFLASIKKGKEEFDTDMVEDSLLKRAMGYDIIENKEESSSQGLKTTSTEKHIAGDTTAMIFWLKNRQPKRWRDKQEIEHSGSIGMAERLVRARDNAKRDS